MGVPAFYKWLFDTFGTDLMYLIDRGSRNQDKPEGNNYKHHYKRSHQRMFSVNHPTMDPSDRKFDNLYIDMNGLIHPCCHPESGAPPKDETEMLQRTLQYVDRIVRVIQPRSLLYLSVDGVAPRAKLNQQRARRFTAGMERAMKREVEEDQFNVWGERMKKVRQQLSQNPDKESSVDDFLQLFDKFKSEQPWDHNVITPGTTFMDKITHALHYYAVYKMNTDPSISRDLKIIVDDASIPGEGEHKIVSYIRAKRQDPCYDHNTVHVIHGLDADLVMLSLLLHEPNFWILREDVFDPDTTTLNHPMYMFDLKKLRRCIFSLFDNLLLTSSPIARKFEWDKERLLDDFVFMCICIGNDFVPHIPGLSIKENGLVFLLQKYFSFHWKPFLKKHSDTKTTNGKKIRVSSSAYFTCKGELNFGCLIPFFRRIAPLVDDQWMRQIKSSYLQSKMKSDKVKRSSKTLHDTQPEEEEEVEDVKTEEKEEVETEEADIVKDIEEEEEDEGTGETEETEEAEDVNDMADDEDDEDVEDMRQESEDTKNTTQNVAKAPTILLHNTRRKIFFSEISWLIESKDERGMAEMKRFFRAQLDANVEQYISQSITNLHFPEHILRRTKNWRNEYYSIKFNISIDEVPALRQALVSDYIQALAWVWAYYTTGLKSWTWYYPHHHTPLLSEFCDSRLDFSLKPFKLGSPLKPFLQLLALMPKSSLHCVPAFLRDAVCAADSPLAHLYPDYFQRDANCSDVNWKAVPILPFMDIDLLKKTIKPLLKSAKLSNDEKRRNSFGHAIMYFHNTNKKLLDHYKAIAANGAIAKHTFKLTLDSKHLIRLEDDNAATVSGFVYKISRTQHILGSILPDVGKPFNDPNHLVPKYFTQSIETNSAVPCIFYPPAFKFTHFSLLPRVNRAEAQDCREVAKRGINLYSANLGRKAAMTHTKECQLRNSGITYGRDNGGGGSSGSWRGGSQQFLGKRSRNGYGGARGGRSGDNKNNKRRRIE